MFTGTYQHNLDAKGRIIMPTKLRDELGQTFYVSRGINTVQMGKVCLQVYPVDKWEEYLKRIDERLPFNKAQSLKRIICAGAIQVTPNEQGRILIPANLREFAGIEKEVVIIGSDTIVEIWSLENWEEIYQNQFDNDDLSELFELL